MSAAATRQAADPEQRDRTPTPEKRAPKVGGGRAQKNPRPIMPESLSPSTGGPEGVVRQLAECGEGGGAGRHGSLALQVLQMLFVYSGGVDRSPPSDR
jgi:hypothetical protein